MEWQDFFVQTFLGYFHLENLVNNQNSRLEIHRLLRNKCFYGDTDFELELSFFFVSASDQAIAVNGTRDIFPYDGVLCPTALRIIQLIYQSFPDRVISGFGDRNFPPRLRFNEIFVKHFTITSCIEGRN